MIIKKTPGQKVYEGYYNYGEDSDWYNYGEDSDWTAEPPQIRARWERSAARLLAPESTVEEKVHDLKIWPVFYEQVLAGAKPFEIRKNDRGFAVGDTLRFCEWDPVTKQYTGRFFFRRITCITNGKALDAKDEAYGEVLKDGYVVLGLQRRPR